VIFDGADARLHTEVHLAKGARFLGWEVVCLGRPAANTTFRRGRVRLRFDVKREGRLLVSERGLIDGDEWFANASWGLQGQAAFGTLVATEGSLDDVRAAIGEEGAATIVSGLLVVRALARDGVRVRGVLEKARHCVRRAWGRPEIDPAIWRT
ncbi:MAG: urease accessory protein UreD, partial [Myxococcota bacterium]